MKKFLLSTFAIIALICFSAFESLAGTKSVNLHITTKDGCDVHIKGSVSYTIFPPNITDFSGTVTIGPPCKEQKLEFRLAIDGGGGTTVTLDSLNPCEVSSAMWDTDDADASNILNSDEVVEAVVEELSSVCEG